MLENNDHTEKVEFRKIKTIHGNSTFILVLPKEFVATLEIEKGAYVKCRVRENQLVIEKVIE